MKCRDYRSDCRARRLDKCTALDSQINGMDCPFYKTTEQWENELRELRLKGHAVKNLYMKEEE